MDIVVSHQLSNGFEKGDLINQGYSVYWAIGIDSRGGFACKWETLPISPIKGGTAVVYVQEYKNCIVVSKSDYMNSCGDDNAFKSWLRKEWEKATVYPGKPIYFVD